MLLGILKCDDVNPDFVGVHGEYPEMFETVLKLAMPHLRIKTYDVMRGIYPKDIREVDAYLITGSSKSVYEDEPWINRLKEFISELHEGEIKLIGGCFGHQLIAHTLGGETAAAHQGWGIGVHKHELTDKGKEILGDVGHFHVVVSHRDQVQRLPEGAEVLAGSDFCPIASMKIGSHIFTVQGHPEFSKEYSRKLIQMRKHLYDDDFLEQGLESLNLDTDELLLAKWMRRFLEGHLG